MSFVGRLLRSIRDTERLDDETFVDLAYRFLLGRASDEAGRRHFLGRLRGGVSCQASARGALVELGYPYRFERLTIVDLPDGERHELYRSDGGPAVGVVQTELGARSTTCTSR